MMQCPRCHLESMDAPTSCGRCGLLLDLTEVAEAIRVFRGRVADHLSLLGDFRAQLEYPVIEEWRCQWFDDLQFGEMAIRRDPTYANVFSGPEWALLARFSEVF